MGNPYEMNLQLFAEGEAAAKAGDEGANTAGNNTPPAAPVIDQSFIQQMIAEGLAQFRRDLENRTSQARIEGVTEGMSEGERLAKMTAEERIEYERNKTETELNSRKEALDQREAEVTRRELQAQAVATLTGKGLPAGLAKYLNYIDADACNASIAEVEKDFGAMLKAEVDKRLAASAAPLTRGGSASAEKPKDKGVELAEKIGSDARKSAEAYKSIIDKYR